MDGGRRMVASPGGRFPLAFRRARVLLSHRSFHSTRPCDVRINKMRPMNELEGEPLPEEIEASLRDEEFEDHRRPPDVPQDVLDAMRAAEDEALASRSDEEWCEDAIAGWLSADDLIQS